MWNSRWACGISIVEELAELFILWSVSSIDSLIKRGKCVISECESIKVWFYWDTDPHLSKQKWIWLEKYLWSVEFNSEDRRCPLSYYNSSTSQCPCPLWYLSVFNNSQYIGIPASLLPTGMRVIHRSWLRGKCKEHLITLRMSHA